MACGQPCCGRWAALAALLLLGVGLLLLQVDWSRPGPPGRRSRLLSDTGDHPLPGIGDQPAPETGDGSMPETRDGSVLEAGDSPVTETGDGSVQETGRYYGRPLREIYDRSVPSTAWFSTARCRPYRTWFAKQKTMDHLVYLASHPRSGNTWLRFLIEASTGVFTGSVAYSLTVSTDPDSWLTRLNFTAEHYDEPQFSWTNGSWPYNGEGAFTAELFQTGFLGELQNIFAQNVIVTKTHDLPFIRDPTDPAYPYDHLEQQFTAYPVDIQSRRAILVIRDPFRVIVSSRHYQFSKSVHVENDVSPEQHFHGQDWEEFVDYYARVWLNFNTLWLQHTDEILVVNYETLKETPWSELSRVHGFLGVTPDPGRMQCVLQHDEGSAHNRRHPVEAARVFPRRLQFVVWTAVHQLQQELSWRGLPPLPLDRYLFQEFRYTGVPAADA